MYKGVVFLYLAKVEENVSANNSLIDCKLSFIYLNTNTSETFAT